MVALVCEDTLCSRVDSGFSEAVARGRYGPLGRVVGKPKALHRMVARDIPTTLINPKSKRFSTRSLVQSPRLTFHLDVSNYYVILTLTILGDAELFGFSKPPYRKREIDLSSVRRRSEVVRAEAVPRGIDWQMGLLAITSAMSNVSRRRIL
jgi:hypothetical protein